jgi:hypothetical protein
MPKALSLLQPWASLVVMGLKSIETRSWSTAYRGILYIHASKGKAGAAVADMPLFKRYIPDFKALPFGAIIGEAKLVDVLRVEETGMPAELLARLTLEEKAFGDYNAGRYAWMLEEAVMWDEPIPARGHLGLWDF